MLDSAVFDKCSDKCNTVLFVALYYCVTLKIDEFVTLCILIIFFAISRGLHLPKIE